MAGLSSEKSNFTEDLFQNIEIEINTSCNRRCAHCPNSIFDRGLIRNERLMPAGLFHKIIDELAEIDFSGRISPHFYGEPLLDRRLTDLIGYTRKKLPESKIVIFTNGDFLTYDRYQELVQAGVSSFNVTQYDPVMPAAMKDLYSHYEYPRQLPAPVYFQIYDRATPLYNRGGLIRVSVPYTVPNCALDHYSSMIIDHDGNVVLCCNDYHSSVTFGNVREKKLLDIWNEEKYSAVRQELRKLNFTTSLCRKCIEDIDPVQMKHDLVRIWVDWLKVPDRNTFLFDSVDVGTLPENPEKTGFWVETIKMVRTSRNPENIIWIGGWAIDSQAGSPAAAVFITFDTGQEFRAYYSLARPDVAAHFDRERLLHSGFIAFIPSGELPPGKRAFRIRIVSHDRRAYYYPGDIFFVDIPPKNQAGNIPATKRSLPDKVVWTSSVMEDVQRQALPQHGTWYTPTGLLDFIRVQRPLTRLLGPQFRPNSHKIEIDITYACNLKCFNCNRSCGQAPSVERMTVSQIRRFLDESRATGRSWDAIRLLGGEPTLHPDFFEILNLMLEYKEHDSPRTCIEVTSNGFGSRVNKIITRIPDGIFVHNTKKSGVQNTNFFSFNIAPVDRREYAMADYTNACWVADECGMGLTPFGYYPCAVAGSIDRVFGFDLGMKQLAPENEKFTEALQTFCRMCGMFKRLAEPPVDRPFVSQVWDEAYTRYREKPPSLTRY